MRARSTINEGANVGEPGERGKHDGNLIAIPKRNAKRAATVRKAEVE